MKYSVEIFPLSYSWSLGHAWHGLRYFESSSWSMGRGRSVYNKTY